MAELCAAFEKMLITGPPDKVLIRIEVQKIKRHMFDISRIYPGCIQDICRLYPGYIQDISRIYLGHIQDTPRIYPGYIQDVSWLYPDAFQKGFEDYSEGLLWEASLGAFSTTGKSDFTLAAYSGGLHQLSETCIFSEK